MHFIIAEDHPLSLLGTQVLIESMGFVVMDAFSNGQAAWQAIKKQKPDFAVLDISMPQMDGLSVSENIRLHQLPTKVILLTSHNEKSIYKKATSIGVNAYLLKQFALEELKTCITHLIQNQEYHSPRIKFELHADADFKKGEAMSKLSFAEKKIFELIVQRKTTKEIAGILFLSNKTIEAHRTEIIRKLDIGSGNNALLNYVAQFHK